MAIVDKVRAHWPIDEDNDSIGEDIHSTWDLTDRNTLTSDTGKIGKCGNFIAYSQENIYAGSDDDFYDLQDGFGFSVWFKTEGSFDHNTRRLLCKRDQYDIYRTSGSYGSPDLKLKLSASGGSNFTTTIISGLSTSTWYWLYWSVDGSNLRYSVNGATLSTGGSISSYAGYGYKFEIGNWSGTGLTGRFWNSLIDEVTYWGSMLTQDEINSIYNSGSGLAYPFSSGDDSATMTQEYYRRLLGGQ